jgi:hypothetical protein
MGLKDKLKEAAQDLATETKKATAQAQGKLEEVTLRRRMDDAARRLGYLVFRERIKGTPTGSDADTLVDQMRVLDEQITRHYRAKATGASAAEDSGGASPSSPAGEAEPMPETQPGAAPAQSPPEGAPTDQASS